MKYKSTYIKEGYCLFKNSKRSVLLLFVLFGWNQKINAQVYGDFPYHQSFTSGIKPSEVTLPDGAGPNAAVFTSTGLQLTPAENNKFGAVFINNKAFNSAVGIKIAFNYAIYDGNGADGLCVFLFDAAVAPLIGGATGGALGYSYRRANNSFPGNRKEGLSGAYLGIALDVFGNFKIAKFNEDERINGVQIPAILWDNSGKSHVTLRGAKGKYLDANGRGLGFSGYPVLRTQGTLGANVIKVVSGAEINSTGNYSPNNLMGDDFNLRSGAYTTDPDNIAYRRAFIDLIPDKRGGFNVTVRIQHQKTVTTVIDNYWYPPSLNYFENTNAAVTDFNFLTEMGPATTHVLDATIPDFFRIGFAASTGGLNDIHKIWNVEVVLPYAAEVKDDFGSICKNSSIVINPYSNDLAYSGPTTGSPTGSADNIDFNQFRFLNADGTTAGNPFFVTNGQGTFSYNAVTGFVTFLPLPSFSGTASISYTIKGKTYPAGTFQPFGDEAFRSVPGKISIEVMKCKVITNPMLPSKKQARK